MHFVQADRSPGDLLNNLTAQGVQVEVCGIYLPNREADEDDLAEGIGMAAPPEVAEYMRQEHVRYFTF
ncbi:DsrE family protein [Natronogracilivirga saccharolytica]|uniref:DsrE family protein n=1 Tax=Natronogracilivirga saccharolytica TaxID=2812953 RepID=A0A8J7S7Z8_9BACT|nr:DsrE family protein [Natronogracilivirga saccharolytica]MBP3191846.1 DsrE family protein [Natronogracilivirga saccharolytica]